MYAQPLAELPGRTLDPMIHKPGDLPVMKYRNQIPDHEALIVRYKSLLQIVLLTCLFP